MEICAQLDRPKGTKPQGGHGCSGRSLSLKHSVVAGPLMQSRTCSVVYSPYGDGFAARVMMRNGPLVEPSPTSNARAKVGASQRPIRMPLAPLTSSVLQGGVHD
jgi:hypothetical protein